MSLNSFIITFSQNGLTPLIFAAQNGHNEAVKMLVQHGAGVNMQDVVSTLYSDILLPQSELHIIVHPENF